MSTYEKAITRQLQSVLDAYLQIIKQRRRKHLVKVKQRLVTGTARDFPPKTQNPFFMGEK